MNESTAKKLMEGIAKLEAPIDELGEITLEIENEDERKAIRLAIGNLAGNTFTELMLPIIQQYPGLDPDKAGKDWYQSIKDKINGNQK